MTGILVIACISWIILYAFERKSILALGIVPDLHQVWASLKGFLVAGALCFIVKVTEIYLRLAEWSINTNLSDLFWLIWWDVRSVITEELLFRGALLYILVCRIGSDWAIVISAAAFGVYHWFTFGILGNIVPMVIVFIGTGLMGYAFAKACVKTGSILVPVGLHLGWNIVHNTVFSSGPLGDGLIVQKGGVVISDWFSLVHLFLAPVVLLVFVERLPGKHSPWRNRNAPTEV